MTRGVLRLPTMRRRSEVVVMDGYVVAGLMVVMFAVGLLVGASLVVLEGKS